MSWNLFKFDSSDKKTGHAPRERVSWNTNDVKSFHDFFSHAPRERVSWNAQLEKLFENPDGHAPRERVSWNSADMIPFLEALVTLHVSVWVEIAWYNKNCYRF